MDLITIVDSIMDSADLADAVDLVVIHGGQYFGFYYCLDSADSDVADSAAAGLSNILKAG